MMLVATMFFEGVPACWFIAQSRASGTEKQEAHTLLLPFSLKTMDCTSLESFTGFTSHLTSHLLIYRWNLDDWRFFSSVLKVSFGSKFRQYICLYVLSYLKGHIDLLKVHGMGFVTRIYQSLWGLYENVWSLTRKPIYFLFFGFLVSL